MTSAPPADICREIDDLANAHDGTACFAGMLVGRNDPRPTVAADALLDDTLRERIHTRFSQRFDVFEARATHSIWMKWYLNTFLPPVLLADVLLARTLPVHSIGCASSCPMTVACPPCSSTAAASSAPAPIRSHALPR